MTKSNSSIAVGKDSSFNFDNYILGLIKSKYWIIGLTIFVTSIIVVFGLLKTPIYQASAKIILASYDMPQFTCKNELRTQNACKNIYQKDGLLRHSSETVAILNLFAAEKINNPIEIKDNQDDTLTIISNAPSIDQAKKNIEKIFDFLKQENTIAIKNIQGSRQKLISSLRDKINSVTVFELEPIQAKNEIDTSIFKRKINETEKNILILKTNDLLQINESINNLNKVIGEKIDSKIYSIQTSADEVISEIAVIDEKITLNKNYNVENNNLLKAYQENLKKIDSNYIDQINSKSIQIFEMKREIFTVETQIIQLKTAKEKLLYQLDQFKQDIEFLNLYFNKDFRQEEVIKIENNELLSSIELSNLKYKELLLYLEAQKTFIVNKISDLELSLSELKEEEMVFLKFTKPRSKAQEQSVYLEIDNLNYQLSEYDELVLPEAYSNFKLIGNINSPQKQFSPNLILYAIYGFISSLSLLIFLFSIINLFRSQNKD